MSRSESHGSPFPEKAGRSAEAPAEPVSGLRLFSHDPQAEAGGEGWRGSETREGCRLVRLGVFLIQERSREEHFGELGGSCARQRRGRAAGLQRDPVFMGRTGAQLQRGRVGEDAGLVPALGPEISPVRSTQTLQVLPHAHQPPGEVRGWRGAPPHGGQVRHRAARPAGGGA